MIKVIHCNMNQLSYKQGIHLDNPTKKELAKAYELAEEKNQDIYCHYNNVVNLADHRQYVNGLNKYGASNE